MAYPFVGGRVTLPLVPWTSRLPGYGLLEALDRPEVASPAANPSRASFGVSPDTDAMSPPRRQAGQAGLLDAISDTSPGQGTLRFIGRYPVRLGRSEWSESGTEDHSQDALVNAGKQVADAFVQSGKDLWTGYLIGASGMYDTAGDAFGLLNRFNDFMTDWTGVGQMSEGTIWKDAEDWLHRTAAEVAPRAEDIPTSIPGKIYAAIGAAPAELAQLLTAARLVGPIAGMAGLNGVRASEKGWKEAASAAAEGALFGTAAKLLDPLNWIQRAAGLGTLNTAFGFAENGDLGSAATDAIPATLLGAVGVPRARQPNLLPLQLAYGDFVEAAKHAENSLGVTRGLTPQRRRQEIIQINRPPGLLLQDVARLSDDLLGYKTAAGKRYGLPESPLMRESRIYDYGRSKWWKRFEDVEVKRENAKYPSEQWFADEYRKAEGARIASRRENEILRQARIQLGKEGRFDLEARKLAEAIRRRREQLLE